MKAGTTTTKRPQFVQSWGPTGYQMTVNWNVANVDVLSFSSVRGNRKTPNPFSLLRRNHFPLSGVTTSMWTYKSNGSLHSRGETSGQYPDGFSNWDTSGNAVVDAAYRRYVSQSEMDRAYTIALKRLISLVQDTDLNAAMAIAESPELLKLRSALKSSSLKAIGVIRRFGGLPSAAANAWLVWSFALKPVISDAYALVSYSKSLFETKSLKASGSVSISEVIKAGSGVATSTGNVKHKFGVTFQVANRAAFEASRLGFTNPAGVAWELVPLSFVFDYFFNVGNYLASLESSYAAGLSFLGGYSTATSRVSTVTRLTGTASSRTDPSVIMTRTQDLTGVFTESRCNRSVLSSFPGPRLPALDLDLASSQLLSLAALLQVFTFKR